MDVDDACSDCLVPPLVLQPLIENAVKHGIATMVEGGTIKVEGRVNDGLLEVSVENGFDPDSPAPRRSGLGLRNVRSRLATRFGDVAHLTAQSTENRVSGGDGGALQESGLTSIEGSMLASLSR